MCGRFTLAQSGEAIAQSFQLEAVPVVAPRYNIAPTQPVSVIQTTAEHLERQFVLLYWGLIPSWAKDPTMGARLINARAETAAEKPSFRTALRRRRCLVVADGFYEWKQSKTGKQPFYFCLKNHTPFGFAGLWEHWESAEGDRIDSCTILTTEANDLVRSVHERMPVILHPQDYNLWLDPAMQIPDRVQPLLQPYPADTMTGYPVSSQMNSFKVDEPACIQPLHG